VRTFECVRFAALADNRQIAKALPWIAAELPSLSVTWRRLNNMVRGRSVKLYSVLAAALAATLASPLAAQAQSIPEGTAHGAYVGYNTAGPVGWAVGGVVGGTIGGIQGLFGVAPSYYEGPGAYRRGYPTRHSYRHVHRRYTTG
jgi:hypothetical protein